MRDWSDAVAGLVDAWRDRSPARLLATMLFVAAPCPAYAHPHVFIDVMMQVEIDAAGAVSGLRYDWAFDDFYSAFMTQGLERANGTPTPAALAALAETFLEKLDDADYFTIATAEDHQLQTSGAQNVNMRLEAGRLRLTFALPLRSLKSPPRKISIKIFDPEYLVALDLKDDVGLVNAPAHCRLSVARPAALSASDSAKLDDSKRTQKLEPDFGRKRANTIFIDCADAKD